VCGRLEALQVHERDSVSDTQPTGRTVAHAPAPRSSEARSPRT
jgi:hypothetical protein